MAYDNHNSIVSVRDLRKHFDHHGSAIEVLRGVDLNVNAGELVAIVGASGAGKSTLLHVLGALEMPTSGKVTIGGQLLGQLGPSGLAAFRNRWIGFVFQFHHLLPEFTALENVMMPCLIARQSRAQAEHQAKRLLSEVGLTERLTHRPGELSGGEQQRVALARALVLEPPLILADEPTGNLDSHTGSAIHDLFFTINQQRNTTIILVTHNEGLAERIPRRLRMVDGLLQEDARA